MQVDRTLMAAGAISAFVAVAAGAFGAHLLRPRLSSELLATFETGVRYQMYHALALVAVGLALGRGPNASVEWAGWLFVAGSVIFAGSLYTLALSGARWWGAITPVGGLLLLAGWILFAWGMLQSRVSP